MRPRLRDSKNLTTQPLYPLNVFPEKIITDIGSYLVYLIYIGRKDITGADWGDAFASSIKGKHLDSPVGIADVVYDKNCWSMKTVKATDPFASTSVRLISGRCSPDYSYGITDPHKDIQKTGEAVLSIWNERVNIATDHYSIVRTGILIRSYDLLTYIRAKHDGVRGIWINLMDAIGEIERAPAAEPVRRGTWEMRRKTLKTDFATLTGT